jgi:hypothetical protein
MRDNVISNKVTEDKREEREPYNNVLVLYYVVCPKLLVLLYFVSSYYDLRGVSSIKEEAGHLTQFPVT